MSTLIAIIPIFCFAIFYLNFNARLANWRESFLKAALLWGLCVAAFTEILSFFRVITYWSILIAWIAAGAVGIFILIKSRVRLNPNLFLPKPIFSPFEWILLILVSLIALTTLVIAWTAPPNTSDSMTYHMSRVMHWIQNRNVEFYPTAILRQLHLSPGAEYTILQFQIIKGNDRFANLVQWFSMLGSLVGVSLLAKQLGSETRGQVFSAVIAATIPMGILQATSTQNDYVVAFWLICFIYFSYKLIDEPNTTNAVATGIALSLAILTKATAYLFAATFLLYIVWSILHRHFQQKDIISGFRYLFLVAAIVLLLNAPQYTRNFRLYKNPLGPSDEGLPGTKYANDIFTPATLASNLIRNVAMHLGTHYFPINIEIEKAVYRIHDWMGISTNDPRTTWQGTEFHILYPTYYDGKGQNFYHVILIVILLPMMVLQARSSKHLLSFSLLWFSGFILFAFYLRWQSWHSRLQLPFFVLGSVMLGIYFSRTSVSIMANLILLGLVVSAYAPITSNLSRPLLGKINIFNTDRIEQYFAMNPSIQDPYFETNNFFERHLCNSVGLVTDSDGWEYPLWVFLSDNGKTKIDIEHIFVENISASIDSIPSYNEFKPCAIISMRDLGDSVEFRDTKYTLIQTEKTVSIYVK